MLELESVAALAVLLGLNVKTATAAKNSRVYFFMRRALLELVRQTQFTICFGNPSASDRVKDLAPNKPRELASFAMLAHSIAASSGSRRNGQNRGEKSKNRIFAHV